MGNRRKTNDERRRKIGHKLWSTQRVIGGRQRTKDRKLYSSKQNIEEYEIECRRRGIYGNIKENKERGGEGGKGEEEK